MTPRHEGAVFQSRLLSVALRPTFNLYRRVETSVHKIDETFTTNNIINIIINIGIMLLLSAMLLIIYVIVGIERYLIILPYMFEPVRKIRRLKQSRSYWSQKKQRLPNASARKCQM